jgi:hypothetical protein
MKNKEHIIKIIVAVIIVTGGSFYAGTKYAQNTTAVATKSSQGGGNNRGSRGGGGFIGGEVLSKDAQSITIKLRDGGSNIVFLTASTTVMKSSAGSIQDVTVGGQVMIVGNKNPDGSVNAQSIQIRPENPNKQN